MVSWWLQRGLTPPFVDDGRIEVVGFRDAWHGLALLAPNGHGRRLAQVCVVQLNLGLVFLCNIPLLKYQKYKASYKIKWMDLKRKNVPLDFMLSSYH